MAAAATTTLLPRHLRRLPPLPGFRLHHGSFFGDTVDDRIAVMQFNQLADSLATGDAFPRVDPRWLAWEHRAPLILQEITRYKPDVVCLQEVDHFHDLLAPALEACGYDGHFLPKGRESDADGSAVFYRRTRFRAHTVEELVFSDRLPESSRQVAIIAILAPRLAAAPDDPASLPVGSFCVATTHLKAGADFEALRLAQAGVIVDELVQLRRLHPHLPVIVASDMNTEPSGPIYALLATGRASFGEAKREFPYQLMPLESAYGNYQPDWLAASRVAPAAAPGAGRGQSEPAYTTWKHRPPTEICRVIDYIWFTNVFGGGTSLDTFEVEQLLELPAADALPAARLPCEAYPSDHLALLAVLHLGKR